MHYEHMHNEHIDDRRNLDPRENRISGKPTHRTDMYNAHKGDLPHLGHSESTGLSVPPPTENPREVPKPAAKQPTPRPAASAQPARHAACAQ